MEKRLWSAPNGALKSPSSYAFSAYIDNKIAALPGGKGVGVVAEGVGEDAVANREM